MIRKEMILQNHGFYAFGVLEEHSWTTDDVTGSDSESAEPAHVQLSEVKHCKKIAPNGMSAILTAIVTAVSVIKLLERAYREKVLPLLSYNAYYELGIALRRADPSFMAKVGIKYLERVSAEDAYPIIFVDDRPYDSVRESLTACRCRSEKLYCV